MEEWGYNRAYTGVSREDAIATLTTQISALADNMAQHMANYQPRAEPVVTHPSSYYGSSGYDVQARFVGDESCNFQGGNMSTSYHPSWCYQESLPYLDQMNSSYIPSELNQTIVENKPSLEDLLGEFIMETRARFNNNESRMDALEDQLGNIGASMRSLEVQVEQLTSTFTAQQQHMFPLIEEENSREWCEDITARSGIEVGELKPQLVEEAPPNSKQNEEVFTGEMDLNQPQEGFCGVSTYTILKQDPSSFVLLKEEPPALSFDEIFEVEGGFSEYVPQQVSLVKSPISNIPNDIFHEKGGLLDLLWTGPFRIKQADLFGAIEVGVKNGTTYMGKSAAGALKEETSHGENLFPLDNG